MSTWTSPSRCRSVIPEEDFRTTVSKRRSRSTKYKKYRASLKLICSSHTGTLLWLSRRKTHKEISSIVSETWTAIKPEWPTNLTFIFLNNGERPLP